MKYMVGYPVNGDAGFIDEIIKWKENIYEVYFSWGSMSSGRGTVVLGEEGIPFRSQEEQYKNLKKISNAGIPLNLLLNANCYGKNSLSRNFYMELGNLIDYFSKELLLHSITTTSPVIAKFVKENFPDLEIRASVNMEIGTISGMEYLSNWFDGYYYKRELNREINKVKQMKAWCDQHGKKLYMLANSGCLNFCSARTFHDNLVAHEKEIAEMNNGMEFKSACSSFLEQEENQKRVLRYLNIVRPEEISMFDGMVEAAKLATRISRRPSVILQSYVKQKFNGNLLELMEPNHAGLFYPVVIDNEKMPKDYHHHVAVCDKNCEKCGYCDEVLHKAWVKLEGGGILDVNKCNDQGSCH